MRCSPAGLGGMALNVRYLQKQGVDHPVAVSGVGLNTIAGLAGHVTLIGVFIVRAGREAFGSFSLPNPKWFVVGAGIAVALILLSLAIRPVRRMIIEKLLPVLARAFDGVGNVLRRPGKVAMLLGGSMLLTFAYLVTLYFSVQAFGGGLAFATVGGVPRRLGGIAGGADPGGSRCGRGRAARRTRRGTTRQLGRRAVRLPLPAVHVLDPRPPRLAVVHLAPAQRLRLIVAHTRQVGQVRHVP